MLGKGRQQEIQREITGEIAIGKQGDAQGAAPEGPVLQKV